MKIRNAIFLSLSLLFTTVGIAAASTPAFQEDRTYEERLRYEASADKSITPAKVIRWLMQKQGKSIGEASNTEFLPIVNVYNSKVRIIAAIAYKF